MDAKSKVDFSRWLTPLLEKKISKPYVHILFGARQTGKSTLLRSLLPDSTLYINLANPEERTHHLTNPGAFIRICKALPQTKIPTYVFVDEAQTVPSIFDSVQTLYDENKTRWRFILCGSSARKLRLSGSNLLPGRSLLHHLYPLTLLEHPGLEGVQPKSNGPLDFKWLDKKTVRPFPSENIETRLAFGELPGIVCANKNDRPDLLKSYAVIYLEEEIRRESLVKDWGAFVRFLQLAALESGQVTNFSNISQESGISQPTVKSYYQLLEDMFIGYRIPGYSQSDRKKLLSTPKFTFFDLGVRHAAAGLIPSLNIVKANPGPFFEQWVGIEILKRLQYLGEGKLFHYRTKDGAEIDYLIQLKNTLIPVEVKWTENPTKTDARHLIEFLKENKSKSKTGFIVCRCSHPQQITNNITAIPWNYL